VTETGMALVYANLVGGQDELRVRRHSNGMNTYLGDELYQACSFHEKRKESDAFAEHA